MLLRSLLISSLVLGPTTAIASAQEKPPGLVLIEGGRTKIGTKVKDAEELVKKHKQQANTFAGETPQYTAEVDDFYLMPSEVTNEQFAEFVRATASKPPYSWCADIDAARMSFLEEQGQLRKEARERGERIESKTWDPEAWWNENWEGADWEVPDDRLDRPVNYITYFDAEAYARWAGLRLMTEEEFQRACRSDSDNTYPWGDAWDPNAANALDWKEADEGIAVGKFAPTDDGIHDLIGNVWEWTSSKYNRYEGYKPIEVKVSRGETISAMAPFDPQLRVLVGGGFVTPSYGCRISVRMPAERNQSTEAVGFRCAADPNPGVVAANWVLDEQVRRHVLPYSINFAPESTTILQRWKSREGHASVPGYEVITGYERLLYCPVDNLDFSSKSDIGSWTDRNGPAFLGFLSLPFALAEPALDGGTYFVAWRKAGKVRVPEGDEEGSDDMDSAWWDVHGFSEEEDCLLLYDLEGAPVVAMRSPELDFRRMKGPSSVRVEPFVMPEDIKPNDPQPIPMDTLRFSLVVPAKSRKGLHVDVALKTDPGQVDASWK